MLVNSFSNVAKILRCSSWPAQESRLVAAVYQRRVVFKRREEGSRSDVYLVRYV